MNEHILLVMREHLIIIETVSGKGCFVASQNKGVIQEEQLRIAEKLLQKAAEIGRTHSNDEKSNWKQYQLAMPVSGFSVVVSKYISVIFTLVVSIAGSILFNLLASIIFHSFDFTYWGISIVTAVIIPLIGAAICLPLTYWFNFQSTQLLGMLLVVPNCLYNQLF